jgi:hypothetical protein
MGDNSAHDFWDATIISIGDSTVTVASALLGATIAIINNPEDLVAVNNILMLILPTAAIFIINIGIEFDKANIHSEMDVIDKKVLFLYILVSVVAFLFVMAGIINGH